MPDLSHPAFLQPHDPAVAIWRYMDLAKFLALLQSGGIYFTRADLLGDPFEGSFAKANQRFRPVVYESVYEGFRPEKVEELELLRGKMAQRTRNCAFVSCWHMSNYESAAMWKLYAQSNHAVAIRSSYDALARQLTQHVHIGVIRYIDYDSEWLPEENAYYPLMHKRKSFTHEQEVRAVFTRFPKHSHGGWEIDDKAQEPGHVIQMNFNQLIDEIYIAPTSPPWLKDVVDGVAQRYGLQKSARQSSLDATPFC